MSPRTIIVAGSFAQCTLAVLGLTAAALGFVVGLSCAIEAVTAGVASEREGSQ